MTADVLAERQNIWVKKLVLRAIYTNYYQKIIRCCQKGKSLEIGGGSGNLKEFAPDVVSTDVVWLPWVDAVADAQRLPFGDKTFSNIVMVDVLHHIEQPGLFFSEAQRVLEPGGRLVMVEPSITPLSFPFFRFFNPEPVDMSVDPLAEIVPDPNRQPFDANQGIPTLLGGKYRKQMERDFPELKMTCADQFDFLAYPLSGGFRKWSLIPACAVPFLLKFEALLLPLIGRLVAFRLLLVFEKSERGGQ